MILLILFFFLSFILTGAYRLYAIKCDVIDLPNHRSSHVIPTPRGGGIAFVLLFLLFSLFFGKFSFWELLGFLVSGLLVAIIGIIDDHFTISAKIRLFLHFIISGFALYCLGGMKPFVFVGFDGYWLLMLTNIFGLFYLVWCLNLYNFMDGINGIAAIEGITVFLGMFFIYWFLGHDLYLMPLLGFVSVLSGFLLWNFPYARIFMGDVGSAFLGFMIGLFSIQAPNVNKNLFFSWIILFGFFIVDATFTLLKRLFLGHEIFKPHRMHLYQKATDVFKSHTKVTLGVGLINIMWLFPIAFFVGINKLDGAIGVILSYMPLVIVECLLWHDNVKK